MIKQEHIYIGNIPAIVWGEPSDRVYIHVHGKLSRKEYAESFAAVAAERGIQTISFDLPSHGERAMVCSMSQPEVCDIFTGKRDLLAVAEYADSRWLTKSLFACSIGAYFSLLAYADRTFEQCLFQSPIVDLMWLCRKMLADVGATAADLQKRGNIAHPIDTLRYDVWQYLAVHPIEKWSSPTSILYAGHDTFQSRDVIDGFCRKYAAKLTVSPGSDHPFMETTDFLIAENWYRDNIF